MRTLKFWALSFAGIPVLGWLASLGHNYWLGGEVFPYSPVAYLPLFLITAPFEGLMPWLAGHLWGHTHGTIFIYACVTSIIYGGFGVAFGCLFRQKSAQ